MYCTWCTLGLEGRGTAVRCVFRVPGLQVRFGGLIESSGEDRLSAGAETRAHPEHARGALVWGGARPARAQRVALPGLTLRYSGAWASGTADMELHSVVFSPSGQETLCAGGMQDCMSPYRVCDETASWLIPERVGNRSLSVRGCCHATRHARYGYGYTVNALVPVKDAF
jgi:hypothetical protein